VQSGTLGSRALTSDVTSVTDARAGQGRVLVLSASGVRTLMRNVPSIQDKVLAALTARPSDD